jgi:hypothetical protein
MTASYWLLVAALCGAEMARWCARNTLDIKKGHAG